MRSFIIAALVAMAVPALAQEAPATGATVEFQGEVYTVAGAGTEVMEYEATGESIVVTINLEIPIATIVPDAGAIVRLDPSIPMLWVAGEEHGTFADYGERLAADAEGGFFALLEYGRAAD